MTVVLIDTNIWTGLLEIEQGADIVSALEKMQSEGTVRILLPERIKIEWGNNYTKRLRNADSSHEEKLAEILPADKVGATLGIAQQHLLRKKSLVEPIEGIFRKATLVKVSKDVRNEVMIRYENEQAPFHANKDSHNDGLIYFSAVRWCQRKGVTKLHFVTANYKDFTAPGAKNGPIHPDLVVPGLEVLYYPSIFPALVAIAPAWTSGAPASDASSRRPPIYVPQVSKGKTLLEKWRNAYEYYYAQLPFVPKRLLGRTFPIQISTEEPFGHSGRALYTNNAALVDYLTELDLGFDPYARLGKEIEEPPKAKTLPKQLKEIFQQLNSSGVFTIHKHRHKVDFDCRTSLPKGDGCVRCKLRSLDFKGMFAQLLPEPCDDLEQNMRHGYVHFRIGSYLAAFAFFKKALKQCKAGKLPVLELICAQNIVAIQGRIWTSRDAIKVAAVRKFNVDPDAVFATNLAGDMFVAAASKLVYRAEAVQVEMDEITDLHKKISEHYKIQAEGGSASNGYLRSLLTTVYALTAYLTTNSIVGDYAQSSFETAYELVVDALFMCHAFNDAQSSRLLHFEDTMLVQMMTYAKPSVLREAFRKRRLKRLTYGRTAPGGQQFPKLAVRLIEGFLSLEQFMVSDEDRDGSRFEELYGRIVGNALTLAAMLDLTPEEDRKIATAFTAAVVNGFPDARLIERTDASRTFLRTKPGAFTASQLKALCRAVAGNLVEWKMKDWGESLGWVLREHQPQLLAKDRALSGMIRKAVFEESARENLGDSSGFICAWAPLLHPAEQLAIRGRIEEALANNFSADMFYLFAVHGIIGYEGWLEKFASETALPVPGGESSAFGSSRFAISPGLSDLINLAFKTGIDTKGSLFARFRGHSAYYDWLLDMDSFDYKDFNEEWVMEYKTSPYLDKMFSHPKVREAVREKLKERFNPTIAEYLVRYGT